MKNARQNVECTIKDLKCSKENLEQALSTVEKDVNRKAIQNTLSAVDNALQTAQTTIDNYYEPPRN